MDTAQHDVVAAPVSGSRRHPALTASLWGGSGVLGGAAVGVLLAAPFYPQGDQDAWAELGWFLMAALAAVIAALVSGTMCVYTGLRRAGHERAGVIAAVFVPVALLLGSLTAGLGALAAPAVAWWLVKGLARPTGSGSAPSRTDGPPRADDLSLWGPAPRRSGLPQRLVITLVLCAGLTAWVLNEAGSALGGALRAELLVWAVCLPALVVVPLLLLRRALPPLVLALLVAAMAGLAALAVPSAVAGAHPSPERLAQLASDLPVPDGHVVTSQLDTVTSRNLAASAGTSVPDRRLPVTVLAIEPEDTSTATAVPAPLRPLADGTLPWPELAPQTSPVTTPPSSSAGLDAARRWQQLLVADGWEADQYAAPEGDSYWLPPHARTVVDAGLPRLQRGPWVRASVVPSGDGAVLVLSARP